MYLELLDESFSMPQDFSLEEFWENSKERFMSKGLISESYSTYPVKIKLSNDEKALTGFDVISTSKDNEYMVKVIDMLSFETACSILFPLSHHIEILEPYDIRDYILKKAEAIISFYNMK